MFTFEQVFAADPANPSNVAQNAAITIFAPGDGTMTPLTITDPDGQPLTNPLTVNANGFGSAFAHATLDRVAWAGGGFTGFFTSYEGMKQVAIDSQAAAEAAAATAGAEAAAVATAAIGEATVEAEAAAASAAISEAAATASATAAANSAALVNAPADTAIAAAINGAGTATKTALTTAFAPKILPGSDLVRTMPAAAVMSTPPTITATTAVPAGLTVHKNLLSGVSDYWPGFRVSGAPMVSVSGWNISPRNARKLDDAVSYWGGTARIEFDFDGQVFAFRLQAVANASFRLWADERPHATGMTALTSVSGAVAGSTNNYKVDFGSRATRRIVLEWAALPSTPSSFSGIQHAPTDTLMPPSIPSPRFMVLGDSYGYGLGAEANCLAYSIQLGRLLGFADIWNFTASPSTGVTKTDTSTNVGPYSSRIATDVLPYLKAGDVLIYQGSINDSSTAAATVQAQATTDLNTLKAALPGVHIIVTSPMWVATPTTPYLDTRTALSNAAAATALPFVDILSQTLKLFGGTGKVGATTGDGNADYYMGTDGIHPGTAGHLALARATAPLIAPLIGQSR